MKLFVDLHHAGLYASLHYLFENRFGWELYRPIGLDWFTEGYWKIAEPYGNAPDTIGQFLGLQQVNLPLQVQINKNPELKEEGLYEIYDTFHDFNHKAITLKKFKEMEFDIVISSFQPHDEPYK